MKKELISVFVDSELDAKESEQLQNENRHELKELVNVYRVIGESVRYNQSQIQVSDQFQARLKEALQNEYSGLQMQSTRKSDYVSAVYAEGNTVKEESVI